MAFAYPVAMNAAISSCRTWDHQPVVAIIGQQKRLSLGAHYQQEVDLRYAEYAKLVGLHGIFCDSPQQVRTAWEQALAADGPVVLEFKVDQEIAPIPPHIMYSQGKKAAKAWVKDPGRSGIAVRGFRQKMAEFDEALPGRGK